MRETLEDIFRLVGGAHSFNRLDLTMRQEEHDRVAAQLPTLEPSRLAGQRVSAVNRIDGAKYFREDGTWVMLRLSGTEPLVRIYAEGKSADDVQALLAAGQELVLKMGGQALPKAA